MQIENLCLNNEKPYCEMKVCEMEVKSDEIILNNLFTLVGTDCCDSVKNICLYNTYLPKHKFYTTISEVKEVGSSITEFSKGDTILSNAFTSKYKILIKST